MTTLVCVNVASQTVPPMHVFPGELFIIILWRVVSMVRAWEDSPMAGWKLNFFCGGLSEYLIDWIPPARPAWLLPDGQPSHINYITAKFA